MLQQLKNLDCERMDVEELIGLSAYGQLVETEYQRLNIDMPSWLRPRLRELDREINARHADQLEERLAAARRKAEKLRTPEEQRHSVNEEIARLEAQLGGNKED